MGWQALGQASAFGVWVALGLLIASCVENLRDRSVRNYLSLGGLAAGLVAATAVSIGLAPTLGGGLGSALAGALASFVLLVPFWLKGGLDAGPIKMQMAFGAWVGCSLAGWPTTLLAFLTPAFVLVFALLWGLILRVAARLLGTEKVTDFPSQPLFTLGALAAVAVAATGRWL